MHSQLLALACLSLSPDAHVPTSSPTLPAVQVPYSPSNGEIAVRQLAASLEENFVFPEHGKTYAAMLRSQLAEDAYENFADAHAFAAKVTADLQAIHKDGHLRLLVAPPTGSSGPSMHGPPPGSGVRCSGWLAEGVAYIEFSAFPGDDRTLADVRTFLDEHKAATTLIVDARNHRGGGLAEMNLIFPRIFQQATVLVRMDTRLAAELAHGNPVDREAFVRKIAGPDSVVRREHYVVPDDDSTPLRQAKVILLVSGRTASAGEHLALALKRTRRAVLIGETTRGAGHFGGLMPVGGGYQAFIPVGRTFDPDTGEGWEGQGVAPDVAIPAGEALDEALRLSGVKPSGESSALSD